MRWDKERPILLPLAEVFGLTLENEEEVYFKGMTGRQLIEAICRQKRLGLRLQEVMRSEEEPNKADGDHLA